MRHTWKWWAFVGVCLLMVFLGGCTVLDSFFGVNPETGEATGSIAQTVVNTALNGVFPGSGAVLTGLGGIWAALRGRQWKKAMQATAAVIEEHGDKPKAELKELLSKAHDKAGVGTIVQKICTTFDDEPEPAKIT